MNPIRLLALTLGILLAGCSFERDPGMQQAVQMDLQGLLFDDIGNQAYTAFSNHPCVVLRYCGEQMGCNETLPKEMDFNDGLLIDTGFVSFDINLALGRKYQFQMLGFQKDGNSCGKITGQPIQMGLSGVHKVQQKNLIRVEPNYKAAGTFDKIVIP